MPKQQASKGGGLERQIMPIPLKHNTYLNTMEKYREVSFEYFDSNGDKKCILDNYDKGSTDMLVHL